MDKVMKFEELKRVRSLYGKCARGTSLGEKRLLYFSSFRARARPRNSSLRSDKAGACYAGYSMSQPSALLLLRFFVWFWFGFLPFCVTQCSACIEVQCSACIEVSGGRISFVKAHRKS